MYNIGRILHLPLECGECGISRAPITPKATPVTTRNWTEQLSQPIVNKKYLRTGIVP
jgi:hypothetical protein